MGRTAEDTVEPRHTYFTYVKNSHVMPTANKPTLGKQPTGHTS